MQPTTAPQKQAHQLTITQVSGIKRTNISSSLKVDPKTLKHVCFIENHRLVIVHHQQATQALEMLANTPGFICQTADSMLLKMEHTIKDSHFPLQ
jgi:hypothetical protein